MFNITIAPPFVVVRKAGSMDNVLLSKVEGPAAPPPGAGPATTGILKKAEEGDAVFQGGIK